MQSDMHSNDQNELEAMQMLVTAFLSESEATIASTINLLASSDDTGQTLIGGFVGTCIYFMTMLEYACAENNVGMNEIRDSWREQLLEQAEETI